MLLKMLIARNLFQKAEFLSRLLSFKEGCTCSPWMCILMVLNWSVTIRSYQRTFSHLTFSSSCTGVLHLLEHEEEYVFTLPSAYARSILTIPWVELGGKVNISCARTGYSATVTFHTKPFYGGKLHRYSNYCLTLVYLLLHFRGRALGHLFSSSDAVFYRQIAEVLFLLVLEMT